MTIAEKINQASIVNYEFHLWPDESIICNADEVTYKIKFDKSEIKKEWLDENYPERTNHHSDIDDHMVITDTSFLKDQFEKNIYLAKEIEN